MRSALASAHLGMVRLFPGALSWVPARRRRQLRPDTATGGSTGPHTRVLARNEPQFHAWLGQNVSPVERRGYAYLARAQDLEEFRGRVLVLPGARGRADVAEVVEAVEARVHCGAVRWAA